MTLSNCFSALAALAAFTLSGPVRADVPPLDQCFEGQLGTACDNAMGKGMRRQAGVCTRTLCARATPDGPTTYECYRCLAEEQGLGGKPSEAGGGAGSGKGGESGSSGAAGDSKPRSRPRACSLAHAGGVPWTFGAFLLALGLAASRWRRRSIRG